MENPFKMDDLGVPPPSLGHLQYWGNPGTLCSTNPMIWWANLWTGFYIVTASVMKGLKTNDKAQIFETRLNNLRKS